MKCPFGTVLRELELQEDRVRRKILVYGVRQGRKHPWFVLSGYDLIHECLFDYSCSGKRLEEEYEILVQYNIEEMLTHANEHVRILGAIVACNPKIKTRDLYIKLLKAEARLREVP